MWLQDSMDLNIKKFGVAGDSSTDDTPAIKNALDTNPGRTFYFPPGSYRLNSSLVISQANSLILDKDARIFASSPMNTMIQYSYGGIGYAEDKAIVGGTLDGALNATNILSIQTVLRFTHTQCTYKDGINRGLVTVAGPGAELLAYDIRFINTGTTNISNNIAIEANMSDCHFRDIITRDWTVGVKDTGANKWDRIHPWISPDTGSLAQMSSRYPASLAFDLTGQSDLVSCYSDSYRTAFKSRTKGAGTLLPTLLNCSAAWYSSSIPSSLANANPGYVIDNSDSIGLICDRAILSGHSTSSPQVAFLNGPSTNMIARNNYSNGYITGPIAY